VSTLALLTRANLTSGIFTYLCKVEKKGKQAIFEINAKKLPLLLGRRPPPGTGFAVPSPEEKRQCKNKEPGLWQPWLEAGGRWLASISLWWQLLGQACAPFPQMQLLLLGKT
jgi:hypothetical protein